MTSMVMKDMIFSVVFAGIAARFYQQNEQLVAVLLVWLSGFYFSAAVFLVRRRIHQRFDELLYEVSDEQ